MIPCLDPDKAESKKQFTAEVAKIRYATAVDSIMKISSVDYTLEELAYAYPIFYNFYPTAEIMKKLIQRMTQIKESKYEQQLWRGFVRDPKYPEADPWRPSEIIMPFELEAP